MSCKDFQLQIVSEPASATEHLAECADCVAFSEFQEALAADLKEWRREEPSPFLEGRIREAVDAPIRSASPSRYYLWGTGLVAASLALGLVLGAPKAEAASVVYHRMEAAVAKVSSVHMIVRWRPGKGNVEEGPMTQVDELWWKPGAWREKSTPDMGGDSLRLSEAQGIAYYAYDTKSHRVARANENAPLSSDFSIQGIAARWMDTPTQFERLSGGGGNDIIVAQNAGGWSRMVFTINPRTNLPDHVDKEYRTRDRWEISGRLEFEFNKPIPSRVFEPGDLNPRP